MSTLTATTDIAASPQTVYNLVSDLPRMGEWSPENRGGKWRDGATKAAPGAKFKGKNKIGWRSWSTDIVVTEAAPPSKFAFKVAALGLPVAEWAFEIAQTDTGCTLTQTMVDTRSGFTKKVGALVTGVKDRATHNPAGMNTTLEAIRNTAENAG